MKTTLRRANHRSPGGGVARDAALAVHLRVDDLEAALALYGPVIGLEVVQCDDEHAALVAPGWPALVHLSS